jgi:hypothetical protein
MALQLVTDVLRDSSSDTKARRRTDTTTTSSAIPIEILTSSQYAIECITKNWKFRGSRSLISIIRWRLQAMQESGQYLIRLRWIKDDCNVPGHIRSDQLAKIAARTIISHERKAGAAPAVAASSPPPTTRGSSSSAATTRSNGRSSSSRSRSGYRNDHGSGSDYPRDNIHHHHRST